MMKIFADTTENHFEFEWTNSNGESSLRHQGKVLDLTFQKKLHNRYLLKKGDRTYNIEVSKNDQGFDVLVDGTPFMVRVVDEHTKKMQEVIKSRGMAQMARKVKAQIPGLIVNVLVKDGAEVKEGQSLLILEAMKMENVIKAPFNGRIKQLLVKTGDTVQRDQELIKIESR
jgi:biotin carboxyl carrier protein